MRLIAFITAGVQIRNVLEHIGADTRARRIAPARGLPLWDGCDAQGAGFRMRVLEMALGAILALMRVNSLSVTGTHAVEFPIRSHGCGGKP